MQQDPWDPWRLASYVGLTLLTILAFVFCRDIGATWDETPQSQYGDEILAWYRTAFSDRRATGGNLSRYGGLFEACAQLIVRFSNLGTFETRHLLTSLLAVLGVVGTWKIAARLGGTRAAFLAALLLAITPAWFGHGLFNPKDIPFATAATWVVYATVLVSTGPIPLPWRTAIVAGLATGAALGVRCGGMFMLGYPILACLARIALVDRRREMQGNAPSSSRLLRMAAPRLLLSVTIAWIVMVVAWPWAQHAPLSRPLRAAQAALHFGWNGVMLFEGKQLHSTALPWSYLPTWFAITLPDGYFLGFVCGLARLGWMLRRGSFDRVRSLGIASVMVAATLPLLVTVVTRPVLYDAHRHFLFLMPPLAAGCGIGLSGFLDIAQLPLIVRTSVAALFATLTALTALDMVQLHPYEYVYFNRLSGGLRHALGRFETDYWGASYKEGLDWVVEHVHTRSGKPLRIANCNGSDELGYYLASSQHAAAQLHPVKGADEADVFLATTRFNCHKIHGNVLHVVERLGVPLLYVIEPWHERAAAKLP
jgi:hypothetical protein